MHKRYLKVYVLTVLLSGVPAFGNYLYLLNNGEFLSVTDISRYQNNASTFVIYGTALHDDQAYYKLAMYREIKPKIIAVGSSRVQQFRKGFFQESFVNLGGGMTFVAGGADFLERVYRIHRPEVMIIGVDFWWFRRKVYDGIQGEVRDTEPKRLTLYKLHYPLRWLLQGKISIHDYISEMVGFQLYRRTNLIGVQANQRRAGFGPDASYYYTDYIAGTQPAADPLFRKTKEEIENGSGFFTFGDDIDERNVDQFVRLLESIHSKGTKAVVFFPPVAPIIFEELERGGRNYLYISKLKRKLREKGIHAYDYHDPRVLDLGNCEFVDGYHGGDLVFAKIVKALADDRDSMLRRYIAYNYVEYVSENLENLAMIPDRRVTRQREVDFLQMGCRKQEAWEHASRAMALFGHKTPP